jgi:putative transposase
LNLEERKEPPKFLIHDRDKKFGGPFDGIFASEGVHVIRTPIKAPRANATAERWVRTVKEECLDWLLIAGRRHLEAVLRTYVHHYNDARPHRGRDLCVPNQPTEAAFDRQPARVVERRDRLGGLIHEYHQAV